MKEDYINVTFFHFQHLLMNPLLIICFLLPYFSLPSIPLNLTPSTSIFSNIYLCLPSVLPPYREQGEGEEEAGAGKGGRRGYKISFVGRISYNLFWGTFFFPSCQMKEVGR